MKAFRDRAEIIRSAERIYMLKINDQAPDFKLKDKDGNTRSLSEFRGKKVVLYFYPKDETPGCTREACSFAANYEAFQNLNAAVIGVSSDSSESHQKFAEHHHLPFILLSDPEHAVLSEYGAWQKKNLYGRINMGIARCTYVISETGLIEKVMPKANPDTNAEEILEYLRG